ncbi:MAG: inorganic pyrophosphatase, partial [Rhodospirillaceae bacterium]|nr:inorganic pyrophosphatase [Rhodospirillaceae bacterium]
MTEGVPAVRLDPSRSVGLQSTLLSCLPAEDPETGHITAVIETPKGSPNKYECDPGCAAFRLAGVMPAGSSFPYDFGFI